MTEHLGRRGDRLMTARIVVNVRPASLGRYHEAADRAGLRFGEWVRRVLDAASAPDKDGRTD